MSQPIPIILCGGASKRLWPLTRRAHPKPFLTIGDKTLLHHALTRAAHINKKALIITHEDYYFLTRDTVQAANLGLDISYILEPHSRNTAPAIAQAVLALPPDALGLLLAADHLISDDKAFMRAVKQAQAQAGKDKLAVFGIRPTAPEIGYGYIETAAAQDTPQAVTRFVEKPDAATAIEYLASGRHYWNSGMLCFRASALADALHSHAPDVWRAAKAARKTAQHDGNVTRFDARRYAKQPDISLDYALLERAPNIDMVAARFGWSDVGAWDMLAAQYKTDSHGNSAHGIAPAQMTHIDTRNTHITITSHIEKHVATIGLDDLVIVDTPDALLIAARPRASEVAAHLKKLPPPLTELPAIVHRPWGTYATLKSEDGYQVKRITVKAGQQISLQYHKQRGEHWVVTQGRAKIQIDEAIIEAEAGTHHHIPRGAKHRLSNIGKSELVLIEVQYGDYLGEDDIVRLEDDYGRV